MPKGKRRGEAFANSFPKVNIVAKSENKATKIRTIIENEIIYSKVLFKISFAFSLLDDIFGNITNIIEPAIQNITFIKVEDAI